MAWVAMDRGVRAVTEYGLPGSESRWSETRDAIHAEVCAQGWNEVVGAFTQYYGSDQLDAGVLMIPLVGFLPADDERVRRTVEAIERDLLVDGFVRRYDNRSAVDGVAGLEGAFLPCSFWLADCLALMGRTDDACRLYERLVGLANDVGLLAEEFDPRYGRLVGNFPQAFTHVALINSARNMTLAEQAKSRRG
jgi:GH15 family glucan-1,4-alpha-glucosidase